MRTPVVAVLLGIAATGCASKSDVDTMGESLRADIASIEEGQRRLLSQLAGGLESLEASDTQRETTGRAEFDRRLGQLESLYEQLLDLTTQNNQLLNDLIQNQGSVSARPMRPSQDTSSGPELGSDEPSQFYGMALDQYTRGNYATARDAFANFLSENGDHELAPDAQYYLARAYQDEGDVGRALTEYERVTELYPNSSRSPAALYSRGQIMVEQGNTAVARRLFTQVESGYPNSPEAPLAAEERRRLGG